MNHENNFVGSSVALDLGYWAKYIFPINVYKDVFGFSHCTCATKSFAFTDSSEKLGSKTTFPVESVTLLPLKIELMTLNKPLKTIHSWFLF